MREIFFKNAVACSLVFRKLRIAHDHGQNIVKIMGNAAGKGSDGLHLLRLPELLLGSLPIGYIPGG